MIAERARYLAEKFLEAHRVRGVERRLAFDAWADRLGLPPAAKRRLWREVKQVSRRRAA